MSTRTKRPRLFVHLHLMVAMLLLPTISFADGLRPNEIDYNELLNDTQRQSADSDRMTMVWWLPEEFWHWALSQEKSLTEEAAEEFLSVLRPYVLMVVLDGTVGPMGGANFVDAAELRASVVLVDADGGRYAPLGGKEISADATNLANMMKPVLTGMLGPVGENLGFFFFPATTSDGEPIASAATAGRFTVEVGDQAFHWRTPLGSVLPPKTCPVDDEAMNGAWTYCPWHGKKLKPR